MSQVECFVYPRLLLNVVIGYDFGFFAQDLYFVLGNTKKQEWTVGLLHEWASSHGHEITKIIHEQEPSKSKNLKERI